MVDQLTQVMDYYAKAVYRLRRFTVSLRLSRDNLQMKMTFLLAALAVGFVVVTGQTPNSHVTDVTKFNKLRSWGESTLYQIEANTNYAINPYLIHLVGTKYGQLK